MANQNCAIHREKGTIPNFQSSTGSTLSCHLALMSTPSPHAILFSWAFGEVRVDSCCPCSHGSKQRDAYRSQCVWDFCDVAKSCNLIVHHIAATHIAAMHNADFLQRKWFPLFYSVIAVMAHPVLQHHHVNFLTSRAAPFGLCFHFSFRHKGFLYKTTSETANCP